MAKETLLQSCWIGYGEDKIIRMRIFEDTTIDLGQARLINESIRRLAVGENLIPVMIDARATYSWDKDAQEYIAQNSGFRLATALITNNPVSRVLTNSYSKIFKPNYPLRIFSNEEKAIAWLKEMMEGNRQ